GCQAAAAAPEPATLYRPRADLAAAALTGRSSDVFDALQERLAALAEKEFFESAARLRDRTVRLVEAVARAHALAGFADVPELSIAHPDGSGGWELSIVRHGRLAAAGVAPRGVPPMPVFERLRAGAESVYEAGGDPLAAPDVPDALFPADVLHGASPEEALLLRRWALRPGTRIVDVQGAWGEPLHGAGRWIEWAARASEAGRDARAAAAHPRGAARQYSEEATHAA
ncbi:hypothetical protein DVB88_08305, partial [Tsukamurella pulmonis]